MKAINLTPILIAIVAAIGIDADINGYSKQYPPERPIVNLPISLRQLNWASREDGSGSCTWASIVSLLRWEEQYELANWVRRNRGGGEYLGGFGARLDKTGIAYASGHKGDTNFLVRALRVRRGVAIPINRARHMVALVYLDANMACILDNNHPRKYDWIKRDEFIREWKESGGWAFVPAYSPMAPLP